MTEQKLPIIGRCPECKRAKQLLHFFAGRYICETCMNPPLDKTIDDFVWRSKWDDGDYPPPVSISRKTDLKGKK